MADNVGEAYIAKDPPSRTSLDYNALRKIGFDFIQKIGGNKWTDFNIHDPGLTILEVLAYAISELGLKTGSPIEDLLESGKGKYTDLYNPSEILPCSPVTTTDYRKILIDHESVSNAWITKNTCNKGAGIFFNESIPELSYTNGQKIKSSGYYNILVEFINEDLNTNILTARYIASDETEYDIEFLFPYWDEIDSKELKDLQIDQASVPSIPGTGINGIPEEKIQDEGSDSFFAVLKLDYSASVTENFGVHINVTPSLTDTAKSELANYIDENSPGDLVSLLIDISENSLLSQFIEKNNLIKNYVDQLVTLINGYRNICESFHEFKSVRTQEIGINADIDISVGSKAEEILAEIYFAVSQFISPVIGFYSFDEMLQKGYKTEEIFEGPILQNGFLDINDLTAGERSDSDSGEQFFYTSDIFNLIKQLNKIYDENNYLIDLRNFSLSNYINNQLVTSEARNCLKLSLSDTYKPKLSIMKSNIKVYIEGIAYEPDNNLVIEIYNGKIKQLINNLNTYPTDFLVAPKGQKIEISSFSSIREDFPETYGIGISGISDNASDMRKAQAKQLKAYLLLFEQIYLNFLAQLNNLKEIFSFRTESQTTYFNQSLHHLHQIDELLSEDYSTQLDGISEKYNSKEQLDRKNRFLNLLAARFGEDYNDFRFLFNDSYNIVQQKLIDLKKNLLKNFPDLSSNRFKAFNLLSLKDNQSPDVWDTENISGYEMIVCAKLGFSHSIRRHLFNPLNNSFEIYQEEDLDAIDEKRFRLVDGQGNILLSSTKAYTDENEMLAEMNETVIFAKHRLNFYIIIGEDNNYYFRVHNKEDDIIARRIQAFETLEEAESAIMEVIDFIGYIYIGEGFHFIEHIQLRPSSNGTGEVTDYLLLPVTYNNDKKTIFKDPYSFQATIIVPSGYQRDFGVSDERIEVIGMERFRNDDFKRIMERTLRKEAPAHILLHIFYLDADISGIPNELPSLNNFEIAYKNWLETKANPQFSEAEKVTTHNNLISLLYSIYNDQPETGDE